MPIPGALAIPLIQSGANLLGSAIKKRQGNQLQPPMVDPQLSSLLEDIRKEKQAVQGGFDPITMLNKEMISQKGADALAAATRVSGGDAGGAIEAINRINRGTGRNISEMALGQASRASAYQNQMSDLIKMIAQRRLELQMQMQDRALGQSNLNKQVGMAGLNVLGAKIAGGDPAYADWLNNLFKKKPQSQGVGTALGTENASQTVANPDTLISGLGGTPDWLRTQ